MTRETMSVWICVDENGDHATGTTQEEALERYGETIGDVTLVALYDLTVSLCLPQARTATVTLADDVVPEIVVTVEEE